MNINNTVKVAILTGFVTCSVNAKTIHNENMIQLGVGLGQSTYTDSFAMNVYAQRSIKGQIGWRGQFGFAGGVKGTQSASDVMSNPNGASQRTPSNDIDGVFSVSLAPTYTLNISHPISVWVGPEYACAKGYESYHSDGSMGDYYMEGDSHSIWGIAAGINATTTKGWNLGLAYSSTTKGVFSDIGMTF
ncbi:hypothetical protein A9264_13520 [Vibrio sp. UCD-FRSSP16_10]|uniref:hypothetical protein n=1 Tax=unclassified Vibrio TaxID=2614977 RepID=UPI0007FCE1B0|nr:MULTISPECIES: hypothetical protein [unclassified Vibrio]OBT14790.1 hypothetical protein A9260_13735 [Vibrio sp. UCD-FRSSP16_30]OBT20079.1 hypothetical protein A9264_13520 [Vibrio sp. UCD-FRSSP16_10]